MLRMYSGSLLHFQLVVTYCCALEVETNIFGTFQILIKARATLLTIVGDLFCFWDDSMWAKPRWKSPTALYFDFHQS